MKRLTIKIQVSLKPKGEYNLYSCIQSSDGTGKRIEVSDFISSFDKEAHADLSDIVKELLDEYKD